MRGLEHVGKKKVTEPRTAIAPKSIPSHSRDELRAWLQENRQEDGWIIDSYLGSQNSVTRDQGETVLRYSVFKYVPADEVTTQKTQQ